jgi:hypothetical protein
VSETCGQTHGGALAIGCLLEPCRRPRSHTGSPHIALGQTPGGHTFQLTWDVNGNTWWKQAPDD